MTIGSFHGEGDRLIILRRSVSVSVPRVISRRFANSDSDQANSTEERACEAHGSPTSRGTVWLISRYLWSRRSGVTIAFRGQSSADDVIPAAQRDDWYTRGVGGGGCARSIRH